MPIAARLQRSSQPTHNRILANLPPLIPIWTTHKAMPLVACFGIFEICSLGSIIDLSTGSFSILGVSVTLREAAAPRFMDKERQRQINIYIYTQNMLTIIVEEFHYIYTPFTCHVQLTFPMCHTSFWNLFRLYIFGSSTA